MAGAMARLVDAVPVVADTTERGLRFASPLPDQQVYNKALHAVQRYDASLGWVTDAPAGTVTALGDAATIATDARYGPVFTVTLGGNRQVGAPTNPTTGQRITYLVKQDGFGFHVLTWDAIFKVSWSDTGNTPDKQSSISFIYDGTNWRQDGAQGPYL